MSHKNMFSYFKDYTNRHVKTSVGVLMIVATILLAFSVVLISNKAQMNQSPYSEAASAPAVPQTVLPWLKTMNGRIVRADNNQPVELRGTNVLRNEWVYPDMSFENVAIPQLASVWHANLITHGFASHPVATNDPTYMGILDQYQQLAQNNGMYIIFAYYYQALNGDQPPLIGVNNYTNVDPDYHQAMINMVNHFRTRSNVLFMLQAEPHSDSAWNGQNIRVTWNVIRPLYDSIITDMRAVDIPQAGEQKHLILASGDGYGRDISPVVTNGEIGHPDPITADGAVNVVYSSHPYDTRAGSNDWEYFLPVADAGYPVLVTEFGTGGQMNQQDTLDLMSEMNNGTRHIGWTAWIFDSEGCPCLLTGTNTNFVPSSPYGISVRDRIIAEATNFNTGGTPIPTIPVSPTIPPTSTPVPPTPTRTPTPTIEPLDFRRADVNRDGTINAQDFNLYKRQQGNACTSSTNCADVNCDHTVSILDYNQIQQHFGQSVTNAPACIYWSLTPTPSPIPTGIQTINFDTNISGHTVEAALTGQYPTGIINWGTSQTAWYLSGPWAPYDSTNSLTYVGDTTPKSATFTFITPRKLVSLKAVTSGTNGNPNVTITGTCGSQSFSYAITPANFGHLVTITTNWTQTCTSVTLGASNGGATNLDDLVIQ